MLQKLKIQAFMLSQEYSDIFILIVDFYQILFVMALVHFKGEIKRHFFEKEDIALQKNNKNVIKRKLKLLNLLSL